MFIEGATVVKRASSPTQVLWRPTHEKYAHLFPWSRKVQGRSGQLYKIFCKQKQKQKQPGILDLVIKEINLARLNFKLPYPVDLDRKR